MIPLWLKISYTVVTVVIAVAYARKYPLGNFLWFSDIALLVAVPALWLESSFLASTMAVGVVLPELGWNLAFFTRLLTQRRVTGLTDYMFDGRNPVWLRCLSLFHVFMPPVLVWMVARLGYDSRALKAQIILAWIVMPVCYWFTDPQENTNWVHSFSKLSKRIPRPLSPILMMLALPLLAYLPTHLVLSRLFLR